MSELYKMILVDDEDDVRGRILSKIKEELGFIVVGKAGNGFDALELIEETKPHVVLTDIKMPFINGIELARKIRRDYPTTKVAFISGYDEFEYAREAIELDVVSYLMKPVTSKDIEDFLKKLKISLDQEFAFLQDTNVLQTRYKESIPILINSYLNSYLLKNELDNDDVSVIKGYGINTEDGNYIVGTIAFSTDDNLEESKIFIKTMIDKVLNSYEFSINFLTPGNVIFIVRDPILTSTRQIDARVYEIYKYAEEYRSLKIQIGVSKVFHQFKDFPKGYRESDQAVRHSKFFNMGDIIYFEDIEDIERKDIIVSENDLAELQYFMKYGSKKDIKDLLRRMLSEYEMEDNIIISHRVLFIKLTNLFIDFALSLNVKLEDITDDDVIETMEQIRDEEELINYIMDIILKTRALNVETQVSKTDKIIEEALNYIHEHYQDPSLSLEELSDYLNISVSYISMLLKKIKGITFSKYLIEVRMEKAKELLKFTTDKVISIAQVCGYNEVYYFSHSFKKYTGMSPKEFRQNG